MPAAPASSTPSTFWDAGSPSYRWVDYAVPYIIGPATPLGRRGPDGSRQLALVKVAVYDAIIATWHWKYVYNRRRPSETDSELSTAVATPDSPSYPSEHAAAGRAAAEVLAYLYPADAAVFRQRAADGAQTRVQAGVNYPSDVAAGLELGRQVGLKVVEHGQNDFSMVWPRSASLPLANHSPCVIRSMYFISLPPYVLLVMAGRARLLLTQTNGDGPNRTTHPHHQLRVFRPR